MNSFAAGAVLLLVIGTIVVLLIVVPVVKSVSEMLVDAHIRRAHRKAGVR